MIKYLHSVDLRTFNYIFHTSTPLSNLARLISGTADGWLYFLIIPVILFQTTRKPDELLFLITLGFGIERLLYYILKNTIKRPRPAKAIKDFKSLITASDEFSLPSGHTSAAFFFVTCLCLVFGPVLFFLYLWASMVAASRMILGVHFLGDVLAGAAMGTSIALLVL